MAENTGKRRAAASRAKKAEPTKAQLEFERHKAEAAAAANTMATDNAASTAGPAVFPVMTGAVPPWAYPPSFVTAPQQMQMPNPAPAQQSAAADSLGNRLSTTLRLGVDVVNATLAGGLRILDGVSATGYDYGAYHGHHGGAHGCGCGCGPDCGCGCGCGGYDCCCFFGHSACCQPSVGSCC